MPAGADLIPAGWHPYNYAYDKWPTVSGHGTGLTFDIEYYYDAAITAVVPEPATMVLLGFGVLGLTGAHRRLKTARP